MTVFYSRHGRHITEDEALDANGALRNHVVMHVPQYMRDGRSNPRLSGMQRSVAASHSPLVDGFGQPPGHRPGFAFVNDAASREARARMYALKDAEYENAWRGPNATCPSCQGTGEADDGSECETCHGEGILNPSYEANAEETYRNTATHHESLRRPIDHRSVDQMVRDHRAHMARLYDARDRELSEAWRQS
jgi:hypothetical protein